MSPESVDVAEPAPEGPGGREWLLPRELPLPIAPSEEKMDGCCNWVESIDCFLCDEESSPKSDCLVFWGFRFLYLFCEEEETEEFMMNSTLNLLTSVLNPHCGDVVIY